MKFEVSPLPYEQDALEPFIGARTVGIHHSKHHAGYVRKLDNALTDDRRQSSLTELVKTSEGAIFNLAAQVWNHDFYWKSMSVASTELEKNSPLNELIGEHFGGVKSFSEKFAAVAASEFGSGWAWLAYDPATRGLELFSTTDAVNPMTSGKVPLLTLDVWEHAYYLDYQNERGRYIQTFLDAHINWEFAERNLREAL